LRRLLDDVEGTVLAYRSLPGEVDLDPLVDTAPERFALTRTPDDGELTIHPATSPTERHRYGFVQPVVDAPVVEEASITVVLVPGLAFDRRGGRLGRGQGYYDRLLARLDPSVLRIGVATSASVIDVVPTDPHDIAMTHLVTEAGVVDLRSTHP
jgi:5-formyltetrahydrofolate cyclo-ligase